MQTPANMQRIWRLARSGGREEVVGAILEGDAMAENGWTRLLPKPSYLAVVSFALCDIHEPVALPNGGRGHRVTMSDTPHPDGRKGSEFPALEGAFKSLDDWREALIAEGWTEGPLEPATDPD